MNSHSSPSDSFVARASRPEEPSPLRARRPGHGEERPNSPEEDASQRCLVGNSFAISSALEPQIPAKLRRRRKRIRPNWYLVSLTLLLLLLWYLYVFPLAHLERAVAKWFEAKPKGREFLIELPNPVLVRTVRFLTIFWFFYFGACIGSFFNVVAGRWPQGRGVTFGGSKCPFCNNRLKFIHNTPVLGWLWCKGRCAFCHLPIATRYLWMEVLIGFLFIGLLFRELTTGGSNLPNWLILPHEGLEFTLLNPKGLLLSAYFQHSFLFAALVMLAASSMERLSFPWKGWLIFVGLISLAKWIRPELEFVPWDAISGEMPEPRGGVWSLYPPAVTIVLGGIGGLVIAWLTSFPFARLVESHGIWHWILSGILLGSVLGWQACAVIFPVAMVAGLLVLLPSRKLLGNPAMALLGTLIFVAYGHHMFWRQIVSMI